VLQQLQLTQLGSQLALLHLLLKSCCHLLLLLQEVQHTQIWV
jgi:hypothetical protein